MKLVKELIKKELRFGSHNYIMNSIIPGTHGSTYGVNPLGSSIAVTALKVLIE